MVSPDAFAAAFRYAIRSATSSIRPLPRVLHVFTLGEAPPTRQSASPSAAPPARA